MNAERPEFSDLMLDAHRALQALEGATDRDDSTRTAKAVREGRRVCERLLDYRGAVRMTVSDTVMLQNALDVLRARLRFFGEII